MQARVHAIGKFLPNKSDLLTNSVISFIDNVGYEEFDAKKRKIFFILR